MINLTHAIPSSTDLVAAVDPTIALHWTAPYAEHISYGPWCVEDHITSWGNWMIISVRTRRAAAHGSERLCRKVCEELNTLYALHTMTKPDSPQCKHCGTPYTPTRTGRWCGHCGGDP